MAAEYDSPSTLRAGLRCSCPRCGEGKLFKGYLTLAERCEVCDLSFEFADPADGPAFFVMSGVGIVVITLWAAWVIVAHPPIWAQFAVVFPALIGGLLVTLRPVKAWLVAEQFIHKAEQGRFESTGKHGKAPEGYNSRRR